MRPVQRVPQRKSKRLATARHKGELEDAHGDIQYTGHLKTAASAADQEAMRSSALTFLDYDGLQVPPHGGAVVRDYTRQTRTPARGRQSTGAATSAYDKACVATEKASREIMSQTDMRRNAKKRERELAVKTAATHMHT